MLKQCVLGIACVAMLTHGHVFSQSCSEQDCDENTCSCMNISSPAGVMISHTHQKGEWMFSYRYMQMSMNGVMKGASSVGSDEVLTSYTASPDAMQMQMHMVMLMYGISDRLTVMGMLNYTSNYMEMIMSSGSNTHHHAMKSSGLSDQKLSLLYAMIKRSNRQLLGGITVNVPTGNINIKGEPYSMMYPDKRLPYSMQLGTGTIDLVPVLNYLHQKNKFTWSAQVAGVIRPFFNSNGYKFGNELMIGSWASRKCFGFLSPSLRMELAFSENIKGIDKQLDAFMEPAANKLNYGGKRLSLYGGINLQSKKTIFKNFKISIEYGMPVFQYLNGIQMPVKQSVFAALSYSF